MHAEDCLIGTKVKIINARFQTSPLLGLSAEIVGHSSREEILVKLDKIPPELAGFEDVQSGQLCFHPSELEKSCSTIVTVSMPAEAAKKLEKLLEKDELGRFIVPDEWFK